MKPTCFFLSLLLLFILTGTQVISADTGFITEELSSEQYSTVLSNLNVSCSHTEPIRKPVTCFDVNEKGEILLCTENLGKKFVSVYSPKGIFQYGYIIETSGSIAAMWGENSVHVYFVRSDLKVSLNSEGEIEYVQKIKDTNENSRYWRRTVFARERIIGETTYMMQNSIALVNIMATSYSQIIAVNSLGESEIIYDAGNYDLFQIILCFFCSALLLIIAYITVRKLKNNR